jgi:predicted amidophosphoribosyltransferase
MAERVSQYIQIPTFNIIGHGRAVRDQSELHLDERWNNVKGSFVLTDKPPLLRRALLVDDLITSGATVAEGARALESAGIEVIGAVTAATAEPVRLAHLT